MLRSRLRALNTEQVFSQLSHIRGCELTFLVVVLVCLRVPHVCCLLNMRKLACETHILSGVSKISPMLTYALCQTESSFWSMLKYWPLYSIAVGNNSDRETSLVVRTLWYPVLPGSFSVKYRCWEKITELSNRSLQLIESNQTQQPILKKRGKQLPLDVNHRDSDALVTAGILSRIPDRPLSTTLVFVVMVCGWKNNWFWFAIIQLPLLFKPLLRVFLAGKQGKRPGDCCLHTLSVCFSAKNWKTTVAEER